jgi:hypothetical protein
MGATSPEDASKPFNIFEMLFIGTLTALAALGTMTIVAIGAVYAWRLFVMAIS